MNEEERLRRQRERAARRAYWRFVIARGLKSLKEGRVTRWDAKTERRLRAALLEQEQQR